MDCQEAAPTAGRSSRHALFLAGETVTPTIRHAAWRGAYYRVLIALAAGSHIVAILGPAGVGKTMLLNEIAAALHQQDAIRIPRRVALVDNADRLDDAALREVFDGETECAVFAAGPDFGARLTRMGADPAIVGLAPLRETEVLDFATSLAEAAGQGADLVGLDAAECLFLHSGGIPRRLSALARVAFLVAYSQGASRVEAAHVERAASLRDSGVPPAAAATSRPDRPASFRPPPSRFVRPRRSSIIAPTMICIAAIAGLTLLWWPDDEAAESPPAGLHQPASMPNRVIMQYSPGSGAAEAKADRLAATLRAQGIATTDPAPVPSNPGAPGIGYFFSADQTAAAAVGRAAKGELGSGSLIAPPANDHPPEPGTIQVFVADDRPRNTADRAR